jgi:hypothetical protein
MPYHSFYRFGIKVEAWEVIALEVIANGWKISNFFRENFGFLSDATELKFAFQ